MNNFAKLAHSVALGHSFSEVVRLATSLFFGLFFYCSVGFGQLVKVEVVHQSCNQDYCSKKIGGGSGVCIDQTDDCTIIATAGHMFSDNYTSIYVKTNDSSYPATLLGYSYDPAGDTDVALLLIKGLHPTADLVGDPCPGDRITFSGFAGPSAHYAAIDATCDRCSTSVGSASNPAGLTVVEGMSGGAAMTGKNQLSGIITARSQSRSWFTPASKVREFYKAKVRFRTRKSSRFASVPPTSAPLPPSSSSLPSLPAQGSLPPGPPTEQPSSSSDLQAVLQALSDKIDRIPAGPAGAVGPAGPQGLVGEPGKQGPAGIITIILQDSEGNLIKKLEGVPSGKTVRLPVTKTTK